MRTHFEQKLDDLTGRLVAMSRSIEGYIESALDAVREMESPHQIGAALSLIFIGANIERVADLATNIGEDVVYLVEGKTIRHGGEDSVAGSQ
ncbi:MAG: hypothetical protein JSW46_08730 [Gemmatimonadota bacterium]|nr:MAG: hypothetical protein JSW46_08730 [Gemmatimonadota bacterium]